MMTQLRELNRSLGRPSAGGVVERSEALESYQFLKDRDGMSDLRNMCPICGKHYQPGDGVVALASQSYSTTVQSLPLTANGGDSDSTIPLGHRECVLPRLLTLLACFRPDGRFVRAVTGCSARTPGLGDIHHE